MANFALIQIDLMFDSVCTSCEYVDGTLPSLLLMCQKLSFICIYMYRPTNGDDVATCVTTALSNHVRTLVLKYLHTYLQTALSKSILPYIEMCKLSRAIRIAFSYFNFWQMIPFQTSYCPGGGEIICPRRWQFHSRWFYVPPRTGPQSAHR